MKKYTENVKKEFSEVADFTKSATAKVSKRVISDGIALINPFTVPIRMVPFTMKTFWRVWKNKNVGRDLVLIEITKQVYFTGVQAFWIVSLLSIAIGLLAGLQISLLVEKIGNPSLINKIFFRTIIVELAPLITAVIIIARSGTAVSVELSTLVYNKEIEVYDSLGIDKYYFLIYPRILGMALSTVALSGFFVVMSVLAGAYMVNAIADVPFNIYLKRLAAEGSFIDVFMLFAKSVLNGLVIAMISCYIGLKSKPTLMQIPRVATAAVLYSIFAVLIITAGVDILLLFK